eukprot:s1230_g13.t1
MPRQHLLEIESPFLEQVAFPSFCFCCVSSGMPLRRRGIMLGNPWPALVSLPLPLWILVPVGRVFASKRQNAGPTAGFHVSWHLGLSSLPGMPDMRLNAQVHARSGSRKEASSFCQKRQRALLCTSAAGWAGKFTAACFRRTSYFLSREDPDEWRANPVRMIRWRLHIVESALHSLLSECLHGP